MTISPTRKRRLLANGAIAIAVATATSVGVALAAGGAEPPATVARSAADTDLNVEFHAALQALVAEGTITQGQANVIREQGDNGSIDPRALVRAGVVRAAQMRTVGNRLDDVKRDIASRLGEDAGTTPSPAVPKPGR